MVEVHFFVQQDFFAEMAELKHQKLGGGSKIWMPCPNGIVLGGASRFQVNLQWHLFEGGGNTRGKNLP